MQGKVKSRVQRGTIWYVRKNMTERESLKAPESGLVNWSGQS